MFATTSPRDNYHLLAESKDRTLCGLVVVPIVIDRPAATSSLHLISEKPNDCELCKECAAVESVGRTPP